MSRRPLAWQMYKVKVLTRCTPTARLLLVLQKEVRCESYNSVHRLTEKLFTALRVIDARLAEMRHLLGLNEWFRFQKLAHCPVTTTRHEDNFPRLIEHIPLWFSTQD